MTFDYRDVLLKAASRVEHGWHQGDYWPGTFNLSIQELRHSGALRKAMNSEQPMCAEGAIAAAAMDLDLGGTPVEDEALTRVRHVIRGPLIHVWNDSPNRTAFEVADTMRRAAE